MILKAGTTTAQFNELGRIMNGRIHAISSCSRFSLMLKLCSFVVHTYSGGKLIKAIIITTFAIIINGGVWEKIPSE